MTNPRNTLMDFTQEFNERMDAKGVTYRQVAYAARVTKGSVAHYKLGNTFPEPWTLILIADYLECSVDELFGYSEPHIPKVGRRKVPAVEVFPNWDPFADYFRERLIKFMEERNMSSIDLAELSGISVRTIEMYLSVHRWTPKTPDLLRICDALDCTPSDLLGY